jgi:predicted phage baseplate assembly protein
MSLPLPKLDKLTYDELVNDARNNLPALAPGWTDYNAHDPGITQIELLAWLTEINSYRLGIIPDQAFRAYLRLVGVVQNPAQVAETTLVFTTISTLQQQLPASIVVPIKDTGINFQTALPLTISTAKLKAVISGGSSLVDNTSQNSPEISGFFAFGAEPDADAALYLGFDNILASEGTEISLWVWTGHEAENKISRFRLQQEQRELFLESQALCNESQRVEIPVWPQHYSVQTVWEYFADGNQWLPLQDVEDDTRAFTLSGAVRFKVPAGNRHSVGGITHVDYQNDYFIRCRIVKGKYDCPPVINYVALNAVSSRHAVEADQQIFTGNGRAGQRFILSQVPVVTGSTKLRIQDDVNTWLETLFWDGYGPFDRVYVLEPETGTIIFGDGRVGRVPPAEKKITVEYQTGGGAAGNVTAMNSEDPINNPIPVAQFSDITVFQPFSAVGGADAETLNQAKARAVKMLETPTRAVTLQDMERLALNIPGLPVARAFALADFHPDLQCIPVNGSTTVVILPPCPKDKPLPTPQLCQAVQTYLQRKRVLTGEIYVIPPHYVTVTVQACLVKQSQTDSTVLIAQAKQTLADFFNPLHGGTEQKGWPVGRSVYRTELLALLNGLTGVAYVDNLTWSVDGELASRCGNIKLCRNALVASGNHEITIQTESC